MDDDAGHVVGGEPARVALDPDVLEAVGRVAGLEDVALPAGRGHPVDLADVRAAPPVTKSRRVEVVLGHVARGVERLAVGERDGRARRAEVAAGGPSR